MTRNNIVLASVPRSGSTLTCHLLNKTTDVVALHEPIEPAKLASLNADASIRYIQYFFDEQRAFILSQGLATSKSKQGKVPDNHMGSVDKQSGKRAFLLDGNQIKIDKPRGSNFKLLIKQPGLFTGMLKLLSEHFSCYATIRNPLSVLQSWNSVDMAVTHGYAPAAEQCDPLLKQKLAEEPDVYRRQLVLLSWFYEQYYFYLPKEKVIYYEDVVNTGGKCLSCISSSANLQDETLQTKNNNPLYDTSLKGHLRDLLLSSDGFYWKYYSRDEVSKL